MIAVLLSLALAASPEVDAYGGRLLITGGQPAIWYKVAGPSSAPVVLYLHGGPGYNSYDFERAVGRRLEKRLRMVYLDQRGSGRSASVEDPSLLGMEQLVEDVERLRAEVGASQVGLIGHGFGGVLAVQYLKRHPNRVRAMVLVETTADLRAALGYQLEHLARAAPQAFPARAEALSRLARSGGLPSSRLMDAYALLGATSAQRQLMWASTEAQEHHARWEEESGLEGRVNPRVFTRMQQDGMLDGRRPELASPLRVPAALFAGQRSHAIGADNVQAAAAAWQVPVQWFERSGYRPYVEEPELFASRAIAVLSRR